MTGLSPVRQAWIWYRAGRFTAALEFLEPQIFQFREDPHFFRILGLCCLRLDDWKGGETYLQRSLQLEETPHRDTRLGLMVVSAQKGDWTEAVRWALALLDARPRDKIARAALKTFRTALAAAGHSRIPKPSLVRWLPPVQRFPRPSRTTWMRFLVGTLLVGALVGGSYVGYRWFVAVHPRAPQRELPAEWNSKPPQTMFSEQNGAGKYPLSPSEVSAAWKAAQEAFLAYHDAEARLNINRILLSDASTEVKERARALLPYLHKPDFSHPDDTVTLSAVKANPDLYEGCAVRWKGVISNLQLGKTQITFDLLVGYQTGQVVEGIVPIVMNFAALLKNTEIVDVLGEVVLDPSGWHIEASGLHELGYRTETSP